MTLRKPGSGPWLVSGEGDDTGVERLRSTLRRYRGSMLAIGYFPVPWRAPAPAIYTQRCPASSRGWSSAARRWCRSPCSPKLSGAGADPSSAGRESAPAREIESPAHLAGIARRSCRVSAARRDQQVFGMPIPIRCGEPRWDQLWRRGGRGASRRAARWQRAPRARAKKREDPPD